MKRLVLFSSPKSKNFQEILEKIFLREIKNKVFAYIPTHNKYLNQEFTDFWKKEAEKRGASFQYIDTLEYKESKEKLKEANVLLLTGGNTFWLLNKLREAGLDQVIKDMAKKDNFVIAGWSAGAMVLTPTIAIAGLPHRDGSKTPMDENKVKVKDLTGLNLVNFEIFPHYDETTQKKTLEEYRKIASGEVKALTDDEYIVVDL